jgi:hypothetical protein
MIVDEVPPAWEIALARPRTRLAVTPIARIEQPDDALFRAIIRLLFADRGLHIPDEALRFIASGSSAAIYGRAGGRGDRPLRHCRARAADPADDPPRAGRRRADRRRGAA